ncbi:MAG: hypothetical protein FWF88_07450 [Peptococcaceae bacterium]|nr:hypothetical protein [Peptococcaceae bacterium]
MFFTEGGMRTMGFLRRCFLVLCLIPCLTGVCMGCNTYRFFPESFDVQRLMFTRVLAIDSVDNGEKIRLTLASRSISGAANDPDKKVQAVSSEGRTFFEAVRNFSNRVDREIFLGHLDYIILGHETTQMDLTDFLDALLRDPTIRKSSSLIACTNMTAEEFILKGGSGDTFPSERLDNLFLGERLLSQSSYAESIDSQHFFTRNSRIKTIDFLRELNGLTRTALLPCLSILLTEDTNQGEKKAVKPEQSHQSEDEAELEQVEDEDIAAAETEAEGAAGGDPGGKGGGSQNEQEQAQPGNQLFALDGYAVYKDSLVGYLSGTQGRAANILLGKVFAGKLLVQAADGSDVSLEILSCSRDFELEWDADGQTMVHITINMKTAITENQGNTDLYSDDSLNNLTVQQNKIIEDEIKGLLRFTKENCCDLVGFGKLFAKKYPNRFRASLGDIWADEGYGRLKFTIEVNSLIEHSRNLRQPLFSSLFEEPVLGYAGG